MFWHDIKEIREWMDSLAHRLTGIELGLTSNDQIFSLKDHIDNVVRSSIKDHLECVVRESIDDVFLSEDEDNSINRIHGKLNALIRDKERQKAVLLAEKTMDKFDDYMKNVDRLNSMINEFKGCVSMARASIGEGKQVTKFLEKYGRIVDYLVSLLSQYFYKINAIHDIICKKQEKKSLKVKKIRVKPIKNTPFVEETTSSR